MRGLWMVLKYIFGVWRSWLNFSLDFTAGEPSKRHPIYLESQLLEYFTKITARNKSINLLTGLSEPVTHLSLGEVDSSSRIDLLHLRQQLGNNTGGKEGLALIWSSCTLHLLTCLRCSVTAPDNFLLILLPGLSFIR